MLSATLSTLFFVAAALGAPTTPDPTATTSTTTTSTTAFPTTAFPTTALGGSTKPGANGYHIVTKDPTTGKAYCLDLRRGKFEDQAPLQMYGCDTGNNPNQIWHMAGNTAPNQDGLQITITNPKNKDEVWCLTNSEPNYNRAHVRITHCNPTDQSQLWRYKVKDGEPNHIYNKWGLAMDVMESNWIDGADIQVFRNGDTNPNQHWDFVPRCPARAGASAPVNHRAALATSELNHFRATLHLKRCDSHDKRQFWRYAVESGKPKTLLTQWGLAMDVAETNWNDGAAIQVFNPNIENPNQHWEFISI